MDSVCLCIVLFVLLFMFFTRRQVEGMKGAKPKQKMMALGQFVSVDRPPDDKHIVQKIIPIEDASDSDVFYINNNVFSKIDKVIQYNQQATLKRITAQLGDKIKTVTLHEDYIIKSSSKDKPNDIDFASVDQLELNDHLIDIYADTNLWKITDLQDVVVQQGVDFTGGGDLIITLNEFQVAKYSFIGCFSRKQTVQLDSGKQKELQDVQIGDNILVGSNKYEKIIGFLSDNTTDNAQFIKITANGGLAITLSRDHLVNADKNNEQSYYAAGVLSIGDYLFDQYGNKCKITQITPKIEKGYIAPLVQGGVLLVNGVQSSCYASRYLPKNTSSLVHKLANSFVVNIGYPTGLSQFFANQQYVC